jgi:ABC-2 type transport system ATP-binding protein
MIQAQHLVKRFGDVTAVDDVSFDVQRGEIFAFLGPNGAGKTTTIQMLTTLQRPTSGVVRIDDLDPATRARTWICTACCTTCRAARVTSAPRCC